MLPMPISSKPAAFSKGDVKLLVLFQHIFLASFALLELSVALALILFDEKSALLFGAPERYPSAIEVFVQRWVTYSFVHKSVFLLVASSFAGSNHALLGSLCHAIQLQVAILFAVVTLCSRRLFHGLLSDFYFEAIFFVLFALLVFGAHLGDAADPCPPPARSLLRPRMNCLALLACIVVLLYAFFDLTVVSGLEKYFVVNGVEKRTFIKVNAAPFRFDSPENTVELRVLCSVFALNILSLVSLFRVILVWAPDALLNAMCIVNAMFLLANEAFLRFVVAYDMNDRVVVWQSLAKAMLFLLSWLGALWDAADPVEHLSVSSESDHEEQEDEEGGYNNEDDALLPKTKKKSDSSLSSSSSGENDKNSNERSPPQDRDKEKEFLLEYEHEYLGGGTPHQLHGASSVDDSSPTSYYQNSYQSGRFR